MPPRCRKGRSGASEVDKLSSFAPGKEQDIPGSDNKAAPASSSTPPGGVITYKRKTSEETKSPRSGLLGAVPDNEHNEWQRVHNHSLEVVRSITEPKCDNGSYPDDSWIDVLKCRSDPCRLRALLSENTENKGEIQDFQSRIIETGDRYYSKSISVAADNQLKEILSGHNTAIRSDEHQIPLDTLSGKFEGVLYDVLTSVKFGLLCDMICENFQTSKNCSPVKMDFAVGFSSILSKVRKGSYNQCPELFEEDLQVTLRKLMIIGCELATFADSLINLTKDRIQKLVGDMGCYSNVGKCHGDEDIDEKESCLHITSKQVGGFSCDSAAEQSNMGPETIKKVGGFSCDSAAEQSNMGPETIEKSNNEYAAKANDLNSCAATVVNSCPANVGNSYESVPSTISEQAGPSWLYKSDICKRCGIEADGSKSLICDRCEAMYHISCTEPVIQESPVRSWYCDQCTGKIECEEIDVSNNQHDCLHEGCVVCQRLKASEFEEDKHMITENSATVNIDCERDCSLPCEENGNADNESPELSRTAVLHLCKFCGIREEDDGKFLTCSHKDCHFKYYHIRCLNAAQMARNNQPPGLWYCPSCLCRACLTDKDDHLVCLCDRCDEAYHTYCMNPPKKAIPKGIWCCTSCNKARIKEAVKKYEQSILAMQVARNDVAKQSKRHSSKNDVKTECEEYGESTEADPRRDGKLNYLQLSKEDDTEQLRKQNHQNSHSYQDKTFQHRQLERNDLDLQHVHLQINPESKKNIVSGQHINGDTNRRCQQKRLRINDKVNKVNNPKRLRVNNGMNKINKRSQSNLKQRNGRHDVHGLHANGFMEEQLAEKQMGKKLIRQRPPKCIDGQHLNGNLDEQRLGDGSKIEKTADNHAQHSMGQFDVLLEALDASEKMARCI